MAPVIEADGLGISFRRNRARNQRLRDVLRGRGKAKRKGEFWALRDVSFQVGQG